METADAMPLAGHKDSSSHTVSWRVVTLASLGGALEYYDFIVFAIFARDISTTFFPSTDQFVALIATYSLFAASYLMRPLGGIVIAYFVDAYGRKPAFIWSLVVMSTSTIAMGLTPSYASLGQIATMLFILFRLSQSACFGGEFGTAVTYVVEMAPRRPGTACGILFCLLGVGIVLATGANAVIHVALPTQTALIYGWRIAFIFGGLLGIAGFYVRGSLEESPAFADVSPSAGRPSIKEIWTSHLPHLVTAFAISAPTGAANGMILAFLPMYLTTICRIPTATASGLMLLAAIAMAIGCLFFGWLADRTSWIGLHRLGCFVLLCSAWPVLAMLANGSNPVYPILWLSLSAGIVNGCVGQLIADLFPTRFRAMGVTTSYNLSAAIFQGLTPLVATLLLRQFKSPVAPAIWVAAVAIFAVVAGAGYRRLGGSLSHLR
ncbi:Proline/betaine transporter [Paraburkholderia aspalathi]|uniref:Proline/betaine transporter n=1 Tax=Paraburkholderia aspalathi TaxID=1324617 RepID=A0ABM8T4X6_9BURK|nr:MFS transporter [Paraburkholderia aspalathi]MBK3823806.1 MHS family MFS transporter [Paraburkholderia aspalathi]MBK3835655.1 MHS family MFS transporter [Paraburkholderia aspalathi]MBK3865406.1 MHS family MFS transporter [Paraburkholderia aspalathi]CAE6858401.1 Proline/betaine transporter [Paraburkholderia aspalathi]